MVSQTQTSDVIEADFYKYGPTSRGVKNIVSKIKNASTSSISFAKNLDPQNTKVFIIGRDSNGTPKKAYSRYTIRNPYQPSADAGTLELKITNYAMSESTKTMSFPPYVKSFSHNDSATWNTTNFLGRPEAVYTYSNAKRSGNLSFVILTDYAQTVDIGVEYGDNLVNKTPSTQSDKITQTFSKDFSSNVNKKESIQGLQKIISDNNTQISKLNQQKTQLNNTENSAQSNTALIDSEILDLTESTNSAQNQIDAVNKKGATDFGDKLYSEGSRLGGNIYKSTMQGKNIPTDDDQVYSTPENTIEKLTEMKEKLIFQPSFFSGSKKDFVTRMEFISKTTKPAAAGKNTGFSFTKPPVCHLHLGDWINNDIIINSVDYDYTDAPWTIDGGKVQPMWCVVSITFDIVGTFGGGGMTPLSGEKGGTFTKNGVGIV